MSYCKIKKKEVFDTQECTSVDCKFYLTNCVEVLSLVEKKPPYGGHYMITRSERL